ncbi:transcription factor Opi1-domain-containing protein [Radiomyces spectabilis]|uniref:transcription factor Opi1-domain-containing protein n=1 Tax=Radiomyces spectabilis TaxID=64574 RepID=UPI00221E8860|nr:transcription factor Opi1-domain-containing protein [Radiomyces spectabilis]KAI8366776.1 transcription factor Opi1-domain-containing protein [Radiomyces spectabilis]
MIFSFFYLCSDKRGDFFFQDHALSLSLTLPPLTTYHSSSSSTVPSPLPTPTYSSQSLQNYKRQRSSLSSDSTIEDDDPHQIQIHIQGHADRLRNVLSPISELRLSERIDTVEDAPVFGSKMTEVSSRLAVSDKCQSLISPKTVWGKYSYGETPCEVNHVNINDEDDGTLSATTALARTNLHDTAVDLETNPRRRYYRSTEDAASSHSSRSKYSSRCNSPQSRFSTTAAPAKHVASPHPQKYASSRWQQIVLHASSAAGTTAAVVSEESMKCLRYCISWLQYARRHIDEQMDILRNLLVSLATQSSNSDKTLSTPDSAMTTLMAVKKEIIDTLRKVIDVVKKYAGVGLPEQAKTTVRTFILALPNRMANLNSRTVSPMQSPALQPHTSVSPLQETSIKLLNLGGESIEMLESIAAVFSDTIERAEYWLHCLRGVVIPARERVNPTPMELE